jgi:GNAT superfamily N-acetyltransferase
MDARRVEEASLNAWRAQHQMLFDGWLVRFHHGYTKRANSITPLYAPCLDVRAKIERCEALYAARGLPTIFRLTPFARPSDLDERLEARHYRRLDATRVRLLDLTVELGLAEALLAVRELRYDVWSEIYSAFQGAILPAAHRAIVDAAPGPVYLGGLEVLGRVVACGLAMVEAPYVGLFSIITDPVLRGRGYGGALVRGLLGWARKQGATDAYLQVQAANGPANRLYDKLGFQELYRYWYRKAD